MLGVDELYCTQGANVVVEDMRSNNCDAESVLFAE
jgi:hypothetical protein